MRITREELSATELLRLIADCQHQLANHMDVTIDAKMASYRAGEVGERKLTIFVSRLEHASWQEPNEKHLYICRLDRNRYSTSIEGEINNRREWERERIL